jgi:4-oxalomesaconate hydratase
MSRRILVIAAHSSDFVWRCTGLLAKTVEAGGTATVLALSYGERGESGELWKAPGQTVENVKQIRHAEAAKAASEVGAEFICFDLGDYPLVVDAGAMERVVQLVRDRKPHAIITHTDADPFNPDHPVANSVALMARQLSSGAGVASAFETITPPQIYQFEPHQTELSNFVPNVFVDITDVFEKKKRAMQCLASQKYLQQYYAERGEHRANHARRVSGDQSVKFAEAFHRVLPEVVRAL